MSDWTVRDFFWNRERERLRAPWRLVATFALALLVAIVLANLGVAAGLLGGASAVDWLAAGLLMLIVSRVFVTISWVVDRRHARDLGLAIDRTWWLDAAVGFCIGVLMVTALVGVGLALGALTVTGAGQTREARLVITGLGPLAAAGLWLVFFLGVGVLEEVVLRGYLLVNVAESLTGVTSRRRAVLVAVVGTAALFGVAHAANPGGTVLGLLNIFLAGLLFGGAYALTARLALPIGLHVAWNFTLGPVYGLPVSGLETGSALLAVEERGSTLLTGGPFGPEGGLLMLAALGVGTLLVGWWIRQQEGELLVRDHIAEPDLWERERPEEGTETTGPEGDGGEAEDAGTA